MEKTMNFCYRCEYYRNKPEDGVWCTMHKDVYEAIKHGVIVSAENSQPTDRILIVGCSLFYPKTDENPELDNQIGNLLENIWYNKIK